jgi:hypothetical protein
LPEISSVKVFKAKNKIIDCINKLLFPEKLSSLYNEGAIVPSVVNFPSYANISNKVALKHPKLLESIIITSYQNHIPSENFDYYRNYYFSSSSNFIDYLKFKFNVLFEEYTNPPSDVQNKNLYSITTTIYMICRSLGYLSETFQKVIIRVTIPLILLIWILIWYEGCGDSEASQIAYIVVICILFAIVLIIVSLQLKFYALRERHSMSRISPLEETVTGEEDLIDLSMKLSNIREEELKSFQFSFQDDNYNNNNDDSNNYEETEQKSVDIFEKSEKLWVELIEESVISSSNYSNNRFGVENNRDKESGVDDFIITITTPPAEDIVKKELLDEDDDDDDHNIEIIDHIEDITQSDLNSNSNDTSSSENNNEDYQVRDFQFDKYTLSHNNNALSQHHALVMQHNKRMKHSSLT